jgi:hypothetical protein
MILHELCVTQCCPNVPTFLYDWLASVLILQMLSLEHSCRKDVVVYVVNETSLVSYGNNYCWNSCGSGYSTWYSSWLYKFAAAYLE